jgi:lysophospholipase L1-like esterase
MKYTFAVIAVILLAYICYEYMRVRKTVKISQKIVEKTVAFQNITTDTSVSLLVLGDSTAVGVGADNPEDSVPALLANHIGATYVENYSVSGSKIQDLEGQIKNIKLEKYDYILVQIGGNNIVARQDAEAMGAMLQKVYKTLPPSRQVVHVCCGNVGTTTILPWFVRGYYTKKTLEYHAVFEKIDKDSNVTYVNLYEEKDVDPFVESPEIYLASDGFHPSGVGYQYWFSKIKTQLLD